MSFEMRSPWTCCSLNRSALGGLETALWIVSPDCFHLFVFSSFRFFILSSVSLFPLASSKRVSAISLTCCFSFIFSFFRGFLFPPPSRSAGVLQAKQRSPGEPLQPEEERGGGIPQVEVHDQRERHHHPLLHAGLAAPLPVPALEDATGDRPHQPDWLQVTTGGSVS